MNRFSLLLALAAVTIFLSEAPAQRPGRVRPGPFVPPHPAQQPGIMRLTPSPAELGRARFINFTPPVFTGTGVPFFAGAGTPVGSAFPFMTTRLQRQFLAAELNNRFFGWGSGGGYPYMNSYGYGSMYGGSGSGSGTGYGMGYAANLGGMDTANPTQPASSDSGIGSILALSGVPTQNGKITWPLGLRLLRIDPLLKQIEAEILTAAAQVAAGGLNPQLSGEIRDNVETVRQTLSADRTWRFSMPLTTYEDSEQFLRKLAKVPTLLKASVPTETAEMKTRPPQIAPRQGEGANKPGTNPYPFKPD